VTVATITASVCLAMKQHGDPKQDQPRSQWGEKSVGLNQGMRVLSYLIGGVVLYGLLGWVGDRYFHTTFLLPVGIVGGAGLAIYVIIRRFGQVDSATIDELAALRRQRAAGRGAQARSAAAHRDQASPTPGTRTEGER
jgi:F0F1-type ATP synthase assembly protein I